MNLDEPKSRSRAADCLMDWDSSEGTIVLNFSRMPLSKLVQLRRLNEGLDVETCYNWVEAMVSTVGALNSYLGRSYVQSVAQGRGFTVKVEPANVANRNKVASAIESFLTSRTGLSVA
jgi:hypothetical protein